MASVEMVTILFTDLVDSTAITVAMDAADATDLRVGLFALQTEEIQRAGGQLVKNLGDGVMAVFPTAAGALDAAVAIQIRAERFDRRFERAIRLRIGVSAGDVDVDDGDYFGEPVVQASRLCASAPDGGILAAELVRLLAGRSVAVSFGPSEPLELKGLPDPVPACAVLWEPEDVSEVPLSWPSGAALSGPLVGRTAELARFEPVLEAVAGGSSWAVAITGESGIGKSRLSQELAAIAHRHGAVVLAGRAREELQVPFGPYLAALGHLVSNVDTSVLAAHVRTHGAELSRLVPELEGRVDSLPTLAPSDAETARYRLFQAVAGLLRDVADVRPVVLALDDLHAADTSTLQLTRFLLGESIPGVLVLVTYRTGELDPASPVHDLVADQVAAGRLLGVDLAGLDGPGVSELIRLRLGEAPEPVVASVATAIARETGGNPFYVNELIRHLGEIGELGERSAADAARPYPLPETVMQVVRRRVQRLGETAERLLAAASILGNEFDTTLLADVAGLDESDVVDGLEAAVAAELIVVNEGRVGQCAFAHHIVRRTLAGDVTPLRLGQLHRRAAAALAMRPGATDAAQVTDVARHAYEGRDRSTTPAAIDWARRAAEAAASQLAPGDAATWFARALEMGDEVGMSDEDRCAVLLGLGVAQRDSGSSAYRGTLRDAGRLARVTGASELQAQAALANYRGFWSASGSVDEERVDALRAALAALGTDDHSLAAPLMATMAVELSFGENVGERVALVDQALAMARRIDDPASIAYLLRTSELVHRLPWFLGKRVAMVREHSQVAHGLQDPVEHFWAVTDGSVIALESADAERFDSLIDEVIPAARATGQRLLEWIAGYTVGSAHIMRGEWDEAEALMTRTLQLGEMAGQDDAGAVYASHLFEIRRGQGRSDELVDLLAAVIEASPEIEAFRPALGVVYCDLDRDDGRQLFDEDAADGFARYRHNNLWLVSNTMNAEIAAHFGDLAAAEVLYVTLLPWRDQIVWTGTTPGRSVAGALGLLATTLGRFDEAQDLLTQALHVHRRFRAPAWTAESLLALGKLRTTRQGNGDIAAARIELTEAAELARSVDARTLSRKAEAALARL